MGGANQPETPTNPKRQPTREEHAIDDSTRTRLGDRFELLHIMGRGGMAAVYRARDTQLDRIVAVKVFATDDTRDVVRREAEAQTLARLNHPNLVTLFDAHLVAPGETGPSYIVMELVDGPSLREELDRGPLPAGEVAVLAAELAEALVAVHAAGIVHRDLKPANILLFLTGLPSLPYRGKLADFGIAHLVGSERVTTDGMVVGTAAYLSPEQARGDEPGPPSDVYALGLILIEALTGRRAFIGTAAESIATRLVLDVPIPPDLPPAWAQLLTEMTARDPATRPAALQVAIRARENAAELVGWMPAADLAPTAVLEAETQPMRPPFPVPVPIGTEPRAEKPRRRRMVVAIVSTVGAFAVAGIILFAAFAANPPGAGSAVTHTPSTTPIPAAPVATSPAAPSVAPTTAPSNPGPPGNGHGNGKGKGKK
ncbi:MAG: protein kinase [Leifsonia sp.]